MTSTVASQISINRGESLENGESPATSMYRTGKSFAVVRFEESGKGLIVFLPQGAEVRVIGPSCIGACLEIMFENRRYNIFKADLLGPHATPIQPGRTNPARAPSVVACA